MQPTADALWEFMWENTMYLWTPCAIELPLFALPTLSTSGATTFRSPRVVGTALLSRVR